MVYLGSDEGEDVLLLDELETGSEIEGWLAVLDTLLVDETADEETSRAEETAGDDKIELLLEAFDGAAVEGACTLDPPHA